MKKLFDILKGKGNVESAKNFNMASLMKDVQIQETGSHLHINNFPGAFGDTQNKNNRVYDQESLVYAVEQFNSIKDENPYFCYMFDGHKDDDSYENIVGRIVKIHLRDDIKCVLIDMKINKGCRSWPTIKNIMADGDPLGASMRILSPNAINVSKDDLQEINPDIIFLDSDDVNIAYLMSKDNEIEYITGESFIQRFDITQFPSFNSSFVAKPFQFDPKLNLKSESASFFRIPQASTVKLADYKESSVLFNASTKCVTNACKFRHTMKDFVDLISMDESITVIKDNPKLYDDMLKFSYLNLDSFEFDKIVDPSYLSNTLTEAEIGNKDVNQWEETLKKIGGSNNIISYIVKSTEFDVRDINAFLSATVNKIVDEDNIFYQIITLNYMHFLILSSLILTGKAGTKISNHDKVRERLESSISMDSEDKDIVVDLIKKIKKENVTIYDYMNSIFSYIYNYVDTFSDKTAPLTVVNESLRIFKPSKTISVLSNKFVKLKGN